METEEKAPQEVLVLQESPEYYYKPNKMVCNVFYDLIWFKHECHKFQTDTELWKEDAWTQVIYCKFSSVYVIYFTHK